MNNLDPKPQSAPQNQQNSQLGLGLTLGTCLGVSLGVSLDDIGLWLPLGMALGIGMGLFIDLVARWDKTLDKPVATTTLLRCRSCGNTKTWKRYTTQKRILGYVLDWCPHCRRIRIFRIEQTESSSQADDRHNSKP